MAVHTMCIFCVSASIVIELMVMNDDIHNTCGRVFLAWCERPTRLTSITWCRHGWCSGCKCLNPMKNVVWGAGSQTANGNSELEVVFCKWVWRLGPITGLPRAIQQPYGPKCSRNGHHGALEFKSEVEVWWRPQNLNQRLRFPIRPPNY